MGPYSIIYADPPWRFEFYSETETSTVKSPQQHYDCMSTPNICALPVEQWVADDAFLILWIYDPKLPDAFDVAKAWGFEKFITVEFRWLKTSDIPGQLRLFDMEEVLKFGTGYHTRGGGCEECWLFRRGNGLPVLRHDIRKEFFSPRREHSRKPDEVAQWIVDLYGDVPRLEMFARTRRHGWDCWGNETDKFGATA